MKTHKLNTQPVYDFIKKNNLNKVEFCKLCDISVQKLNNFFAQKQVKASTIIKICQATKISSDQILNLKF